MYKQAGAPKGEKCNDHYTATPLFWILLDQVNSSDHMLAVDASF